MGFIISATSPVKGRLTADGKKKVVRVALENFTNGGERSTTERSAGHFNVAKAETSRLPRLTSGTQNAALRGTRRKKKRFAKRRVDGENVDAAFASYLTKVVKRKSDFPTFAVFRLQELVRVGVVDDLHRLRVPFQLDLARAERNGAELHRFRKP